MTLKDLLGHDSIETTIEYLQVAQLPTQKKFSPLDNCKIFFNFSFTGHFQIIGNKPCQNY